nr:ATP-binding protein [uncultured Candidatus Microthrix sp.]
MESIVTGRRNPSTAAQHWDLLGRAAFARILRNVGTGRRYALFGDDESSLDSEVVERARADLDQQSGRGGDGQDPRFWERLAQNLTATATATAPPEQLRRQLWGGDAAVAILAAGGLAEEDVSMATIIGLLQRPNPSMRPCVGLIDRVMGEPDDEPRVLWPLCRSLIDRGFLQIENRADLRVEWSLQVPAPVLDACRGLPATAWSPTRRFRLADSLDFNGLVASAGHHERVRRLAGMLGDGTVDVVVLRGATGSGRLTTARAMAGLLGRPVLVHDGLPAQDASAAAEAILANAVVVVRLDLDEGESADLGWLRELVGPLVVALGRRGAVTAGVDGQATVLDVPRPNRVERGQLWSRALPRCDPDVLDQVTRSMLISGGTIGSLATAAYTAAGAEGTSVGLVQLRAAAKGLHRSGLEPLATPLQRVESAPVVPPVCRTALNEVVSRCEVREDLTAASGPAFSGTVDTGVRALFSGASGTGKTLAARWLGARLDLEVYRLDLAAVVDKYIGETERRLDRLFTAAENADVLLLLDEGDALMAKRTDVSGANDRYANLETNFLLQRLEGHQGVVVVTTNALDRIDTAFLRRLDAVIDFPSPGADERAEIWAMHLPARRDVSPEYLRNVAVRCRLSGGQIRKVAQAATVASLAAARVREDASPAVTDDHLDAAIRAEYRRAGVPVPLADGAEKVRPITDPLDFLSRTVHPGAAHS